MLSWVCRGEGGFFFVFLLIGWSPASLVVMSKGSTQNAPASAQLHGLTITLAHTHLCRIPFSRNCCRISHSFSTDVRECQYGFGPKRLRALRSAVFMPAIYLSPRMAMSRNGFVPDGWRASKLALPWLEVSALPRGQHAHSADWDPGMREMSTR